MPKNNSEEKTGYKCAECGEATGEISFFCPEASRFLQFVIKYGDIEDIEDEVKKKLVDGIIWHNLDRGLRLCKKCATKWGLSMRCKYCDKKLLPYSDLHLARKW